MDFLKWIFSMSMALALMFFGMQPDQEKEEASNKEAGTSVQLLLR